MAQDEHKMIVEEMRKEVSLTYQEMRHPTLEEVQAAEERFEAEKVYGWHEPFQEGPRTDG